MLKSIAEHYGSELNLSGRHDKTMLNVKQGIGQLIRKHARGGNRLVEIGAEGGWQTMYYQDCMSETGRPTIYDWRDHRQPKVKDETEFHQVDIECQDFPDKDDCYDVIVCNQVLEHIKNIFLPISEMYRILKPGGLLVISVPNMCALHNVALVALGRQPTTMKIQGSHVRGFAIWAMDAFLTFNGLFKVLELQGFGLHPLSSARMPRGLRTYCHTPVWALEKQATDKATWKAHRDATFTTTNF